MSSTKNIMRPVRVSELFGGSQSANKRPESEHKRMVPIRVKPLLEREIELTNAARNARKSLFVAPKNTVRRTLYPGPSPARVVNNIRRTQVTQPSRTPKTKQQQSTKTSRMSLLPQPNSIAKKYIQNSTTAQRQSTIMEENTPVKVPQRATVIQSVKTVEKDMKKRPPPMNETTNINSDNVESDNDADSVIEDLEKSIADKENIPPPREVHKVQPLAENKARQYDNVDILHFLGLYKSSISRMESLESSVEQITTDMRSLEDSVGQMSTEIKSLSDSMQRIEAMLQILMNQRQNSLSVADVTSTPKILVEITSPIPSSSNNKENSLTTSKKKRRSSKGFVSEPRRSLRLMNKPTQDKQDSFLELEKQLDIKHASCKSVPPRPKVPRTPNDRGKPKGERPLREYLALKASTSFLQTPDANGFRSRLPLDDNTPARQNILRRSLSAKIFQELTDLYDDSSEHAATDTVLRSHSVD